MKRTFFWGLLINVWCLACPHVAAGQDYFLKHFTVDNGLPSNETYNVLEASDGYLLIATDRGIVRYDGYTFEPVFLKGSSIVTPVYDIYQAPGGENYFPGVKGQLYIYNKGTLTDYKYNAKLTADKSAGLLIAYAIAIFNDSLLVKFNNSDSSTIKVSADGTVVREQRPPGIYFDLPPGFYYKTFNDEDRENTVQPIYITWKDGTTTVDSIRLSWRNGYIRKPFYLSTGGTDIFCVGRWLLQYRQKKKISEQLLPKDPLCIEAGTAQELLIGFEEGGVSGFYLSNTGVWTQVSNNLSPLSVTGIHKDFQNGYWFTTLEDGLYYIYPSAATYREDSSRISYFAAAQGKVYACRQNGQVSIFANGRQSGQINIPLHTGERLFSMSFSPDQEPIITTGIRFGRFRDLSWEFHTGFDRNFIQVSNDLAYGAGIVEAELHEYNMNTGHLLKTIPLPKRILSIQQDTGATVWLGTIEGLYHYDGTELRNVSSSYTPLQDRIISIKKLSGGWLAVATLSNGLVLLKGSERICINTSNGLITPIINDMQVEGDTIWLATNKGISEINVATFSIRHFGNDYGLPTLNISTFIVEDGFLYFKWINKIVIIDIDRLRTLKPASHVLISSVQVNGTAQELAPGHTWPHDQNNVTFSFNSINFAFGNYQLYRYRLSGFKEEWQYTHDRQAFYTNLGPGDYSFVVQVADAAGNFKSTPALFQFSIEPAFWQRWWFIVLYCLAIGAIILFIFRIRFNAIRRRNKLILDLADSRQKALVQLISPHFVFNMLNTAQSSILLEDKLKAASLISRIARLLRLSLEAGSANDITLTREIELLKNYVELEQIRVPDLFRFDLNTGPGINTDVIRIPGMLLQPFIENAIMHGMLHLKTRTGLIEVRIYFENETLFCTVEDNGIGRDAAAMFSEKREEKYYSMGIEITRKRLELLHQERHTAFHFMIIDKKDESGGASGTTITFSVPYQKAL